VGCGKMASQPEGTRRWRRSAGFEDEPSGALREPRRRTAGRKRRQPSKKRAGRKGEGRRREGRKPPGTKPELGGSGLGGEGRGGRSRETHWEMTDSACGGGQRRRQKRRGRRERGASTAGREPAGGCSWGNTERRLEPGPD